MSIIRYNGITLPYALILRFSQDALRDPESDTDWYLSRFDILAQCMISTDYAATIFQNDTSGLAGLTIINPADMMRTIYSRLMEHRKTLSITFNNVELIPQRAGVEGTVDADNGPKPQSCIITELTNSMFLVQYRIVAHYWENNNITIVDNQFRMTNIATPQAMLYNRWSETVDIDENDKSTRTRSGKYVIRSDTNKQLVSADSVRNSLAVIGVPFGFLRRGASYTITPDGLGIQYRVTDQETYQMPPSPAFRAKGYYRESTTINGSKRYLECGVRLTGSTGTDQSVLARAAIAVVTSKVAQRAQALTSSDGLEKGMILELGALFLDMYENEVDFNSRYMMAATDGQILVAKGGSGKPNPIAAFGGISAKTPESNRNYHPNYFTRGTAGLVLQAAAYNDPNILSVLKPNGTTDQNVAVTAGNEAIVQMSEGKIPGTAGLNPE